MIRIEATNATQGEWNGLLSGFLDLSLLQTWEYGEAKKRTGKARVERLLFIEADGQVVGACQCFVLKAPIVTRGLVWVNRGPLWRKDGYNNAGRFLEMVRQLRQYWVVERQFYLLIAPTVMRDEIDEKLIVNDGFSVSLPLRDWASARLDLFQPLETIRGNLKQKWRNSLSKSERFEIDLQSGVSSEIVLDVLNQYEVMLKEKNLKGTAPSSFLKLLQGYLEEDSKLWGLKATLGGEILGGILIARYGTVCEYLVGAFNEKGKKVNAGNFLLWHAISQMKGLGYKWFDLGGMHPKTTPSGIFHFKSGINALPYRYFGEFTSHNKSITNSVIKFIVDSRRSFHG